MRGKRSCDVDACASSFVPDQSMSIFANAGPAPVSSRRKRTYASPCQPLRLLSRNAVFGDKSLLLTACAEGCGGNALAPLDLHAGESAQHSVVERLVLAPRPSGEQGSSLPRLRCQRDNVHKCTYTRFDGRKQAGKCWISRPAASAHGFKTALRCAQCRLHAPREVSSRGA